MRIVVRVALLDNEGKIMKQADAAAVVNAPLHIDHTKYQEVTQSYATSMYASIVRKVSDDLRSASAPKRSMM